MRLVSPMVGIFGFVIAMMGQAVANAPAPVHSGQSMGLQENVTLTSATVEKVIQVLPKLISLTKSHTGKHSVGPDKKAGKNNKYNAFTLALQTLSGQHGFKDMTTMQRTVEATMLAAGFIKSGRTLKQVEEKMLETQALVEKNKKMTPQQKSSLLRRMQIQISMVIPSPENIATVKPFYPRILAITGKK